MTERMRMFLVAIGLISAQLLLSFQPTADANGDIDLFPNAVLWLGAMALASGFVMAGMLHNAKQCGWGPLLLGTIGSGLIVLLAKVEHGIEPNLAVVAIMVAAWMLFSILRCTHGRRGK